jgi:uncharacterized protein (TIGR03067 family)
MMSYSHTLAFLLLICPATLAYVQGGDKDKQKAIEQEWKLRNGTWEPVAVIDNGKEIPVPKDNKVVLTYKDDQYADLLDGKVVGEGVSKIDPTQNPKALDIIPKKGPTVYAIYELKGDEYKVCLALPPGAQRPKDFTSAPGSVHLLLTFKRVKS